MKKVFVIAITALISANAIAQQSAATATPKQGKNHHGKGAPTSEERIQHKVQLMQSQLGLNAEQVKKVSTAMLTRNEALKNVRVKTGENKDAFRTEAMPIRKQFHASLKTILTPEQFAKMMEMRKNNRRANPNTPASKPMEGDDLIDETEPDLRKN